jgi:hypothetical protein
VKLLNVTIDSTIYLGYFDTALKAGTRVLWRMNSAGFLQFKVSELTFLHLDLLPLRARALAKGTLRDDDILRFNEASEELANEYIKCGILKSTYIEIAQHIAVCSINHCSNMVSTQVPRIITPEKNEALNCFNQLQGYPRVKVLNPFDFVSRYAPAFNDHFQINTQSSFLTQPV